MAAMKKTAGQKDKQIESKDVLAGKMLQEFDLLLEEIQAILEKELVQIYLVRQSDQEKRVCDFLRVLEILIRLLREKKNCSIREEAVLAYAQIRLKELSQV